MLIRGRVWLSWCNLVPIVALVSISLVVFTSAAPVTREKVSAEGDSDKPLVRAKRADEIIFDNVQNVAAASSAGSSPVKKSDLQIGAKSDDVTKSAGKQQESLPTANSEPEIAEKNADADESVGNEDSAVENDSSESSDNSASDSADSGTWDSDSDDADKRRRRRESDAEAKDEAAADRTKREASAAMVAENMAVVGTGSSRLQRAKRDLDADEIREIFEAEQPIVGSLGGSRGPEYEGSEYGVEGSPREYADAIVAPTDEGEDEDEGGEYEDVDEETDEEFDDDETPELKYVGRPKRRATLTEEEREEALEEAERQVVRELLAERAAEETRQALINYLTGFEAQNPEPLRIVERFDERFRDEGLEEGYDGDEEDNSIEEENEFEEDDDNLRGNFDDEPVEGGQEELIADGDGRFLAEEGGSDSNEIEEQPPSIVEQKRFSYPYSYEPYGGRWGALLPGAKRDDHDPYDRLYRLAEALSRPSSIGGGSETEDEYKK